MKNAASRPGHSHRPPSGPITRSGSQVEICGTKHSSTTAAIIKSTNGSVPQITSLKGISGATLRITKMFRPTGGGGGPTSITMVMTTPNQMMSKPAARSGGRMIGAVIRMIDTGGRKNPSTTTITRIAASNSQRGGCISTIDSATDYEMCR